MIPRIIHQTWKDENIPSQYLTLIETWKRHHPTWKYMFWTDTNIRDLISSKEPKMLSYFDNIKIGVQKADVGRYVILKHFGGFYCDLDTECIKSLEMIPNFNQHSLITAPSQMNIIEIAVLGSCVQHPIWDRVLQALLDNQYQSRSVLAWQTWIANISAAYNVLIETGPIFFETQLLRWIREKQPMYDTICILPVDAFYPMDSLFPWRSYSTNNSYAVHHSFKSWVSSPLDTACTLLMSSLSGMVMFLVSMCIVLIMFVKWIHMRSVRPLAITTTNVSHHEPSNIWPVDASIADMVHVEWVEHQQWSIQTTT